MSPSSFSEGYSRFRLVSFAVAFCVWILPYIQMQVPALRLPFFFNTMLQSTVIVFIGSVNSLHTCAKEHTRSVTGAEGAEMEKMDKSSAQWFPIVASCFLFGLYIAFKYVNPELLNLLFKGYFSIIGVWALSTCLAPVVRVTAPALFAGSGFGPFTVKVPFLMDAPETFTIHRGHIVATSAAGAVGWGYLVWDHFLANNAIAMGFCLQGLELMSIGSFKIAAIFLSGAFFYDIFWVFGTDVMVTVAKSINGPIKLLFPRFELDPKTGKEAMSMLGLGDIILPGLLVALMLRFDYDNALRALKPTKNKKNPPVVAWDFPQPFFKASVLAYFAAIVVTIYIMMTFQAAQPALLYLSPACVLTPLIVAAAQGKLKALFAFTEEEEEEEKKEEKPKEE